MLPDHKTKIVCTIGPASQHVDIISKMIGSGMSIARLNFSHGDAESHRSVIATIRAAALKTGRPVAIMGDLPGPKIRIGELTQEWVELQTGDLFTLTTDDVAGDQYKVSVSFAELPQAVKPGDFLYINDGFISLQVNEIAGAEVRCTVKVGGRLRSRKGINFPGANLGISAFTANDRGWLEFAAAEGIDAISQSFVAAAEDIHAVRTAAEGMGYSPFLIAKIERSRALDHLEDIIDAADGIMIARGDLGVETPIEKIALVQKQIIHQARLAGKPVITATQMLESMTGNRRPTRAEATDVANAIIDGTDCVMLSAESAMGKYPVAATAMLASIAKATEEKLPQNPLVESLAKCDAIGHRVNLIALAVHTVLAKCSSPLLIVPTESGATARNIARFRHRIWIQAVTRSRATAAGLLFSFGVHTHRVERIPTQWKEFIAERTGLLKKEGDRLALLIEGPSPDHPDANHRLELLKLESTA